MTIDEMRNHEWVVSWSGGKDSTPTIILMREHNIPIKEIVYVRMMYDDTLPATLPVMTDFVDMAKKVFEDWGYSVRVVKSIKSASDEINSIFNRSKYTDRIGKKHGVANFARAACAMTRNKIRTIKSCVSQKGTYRMIGYASDELHRLKSLGEYEQSIMVELGIKEEEAFDICKKYNLLSPLYELGFKRDGCWFCPSCSKRERESTCTNIILNWFRRYGKCAICVNLT